MSYSVDLKKSGGFYKKQKRRAYTVGSVHNKFRIVGMVVSYRAYFHYIPPFSFLIYSNI